MKSDGSDGLWCARAKGPTDDTSDENRRSVLSTYETDPTKHYFRSHCTSKLIKQENNDNFCLKCVSLEKIVGEDIRQCESDLAEQLCTKNAISWHEY